MAKPISKTRQIMQKFAFLAICAFGVGVAANSTPAQTRRRQPIRPKTVVATVTTVKAADSGSGVGAANGSGIGAANGSGIGTPGGSALGAPSGAGIGTGNGSGIGVTTAPRTGVGIRTVVLNNPSAGVRSTNGTSIGRASGTGMSMAAEPEASPRTYIKELNGRCYYVTDQGHKRFVARSNCSMYP